MSETEDATGRDARQFKGLNRFNRLYSDWLNARAASLDPRLPEDDESVRERTDRQEATTHALLMQPVVDPWMILRKWEALESLLELDADNSYDRRIVAAVGCMKADLLACGILH